MNTPAHDAFVLTPWITQPTITVGDVIARIQQIILEEPRRLNMDTWMTDFAHTLTHRFHLQPPPACGTVGCVAGWVAVLFRPDLRVRPRSISSMAERVLGYIPENIAAMEYLPSDMKENYRDVGSLFSCAASNEFGETESLGEPGTRFHAQAVARRLDVYLDQHPKLRDRVLVTEDVRKLFARDDH
jgi:hypothetical protein